MKNTVQACEFLNMQLRKYLIHHVKTVITLTIPIYGTQVCIVGYST
jgi:hypothetical protein